MVDAINPNQGAGYIFGDNGDTKGAEEKKKIFSIFDNSPQDAKIDTSEQMKTIRNIASSFGNYVGIWDGYISRFFQTVINYVTDQSGVDKADAEVKKRQNNAKEYLNYCVQNNDQSPFETEEDMKNGIVNDDGNTTLSTHSYTTKYDKNGVAIRHWDDGETRTYSKDNDLLVTHKEFKDGTTYDYKYNQDGSYTLTEKDGTVEEYDKFERLTRRTYSDGTIYDYKNNDDDSYSAINGKDNTWLSSYHKDDTAMGKKTNAGNYKFYPAREITIEDAAAMIGCDSSELAKANPKAAKLGKFVPPNDIYVPKGILKEDFDPSKVIV